MPGTDNPVRGPTGSALLARPLAVLAGAALLLGSGVGHGIWTERWGRYPEVDAAAARLEGLPDNLGPWKGQAVDQDAESLAIAGAAGSWVRRFRHEKTGEVVLVMLLCGRSGQMAVHRPEDCYRTAGYSMTAPPRTLRLEEAGLGDVALWTGVFVRDDAFGPVYQRIFWTWGAPGGDEWLAPEQPRLTLSRYRAVYKLYVMGLLQGPRDPVASDPCQALMSHLFPVLKRALSGGGEGQS